jgi:hypothetical protein
VRACVTLASSLHREALVIKAGIVVGVVTAYLGCYSPDLRDCTVQCSASTDCTGGQVCRDDGWCAMPEIKDCPKNGAATVDAASMTNTPDARSLCEQGCSNGDCVGGVCVIDCSATSSCQNDVTCPANVPCRIVCGHQACVGKISCGQASSCEIKCNGDSSCRDDILCNANRCDVDCSGPNSCQKRTRCTNACACEVTCTGSGSCSEASECPSSTCRIGNGCSTQPTGCNDC